MTSNSDDRQPMPSAPQKQTVWKLTKKKFFWSIAIVLILIVVAAVVFIWLQNDKADQPNLAEQDTRQDDGPIIMTAEERYRFENIKRTDGVVKDIDGDRLTVDRSDGDSLEFQLIDATQYVRGEQAYAGDRQSVTSGKKVSISYDQNNNYVQTIWVDYDVAINN